MTPDNISTLISSATHIHFIGIGGISMSSLAKLLALNGKTVSGSDRSDAQRSALEHYGITFFVGHSSENLDGVDLIVYTSAVSEDNEELVHAKAKGIPAVTRAELLGEMMRHYGTSIAVSGMHGKTTTSAMTAFVLMHCGFDPTAVIGGNIPEIGGALHVGSDDCMVLEACEYTNSFLNFFPKFAAILNVEEDHLDYFRDLEHIKESFSKFTQNIDKDGAIVVCADNENAMETVKNCDRRVITYAIDGDADITAKNLVSDHHGCFSFDVYENGKLAAHSVLKIPGKYNVYNALAAFGLSRLYGANAVDIASALSGFHGADRRFQFMGKFNGADVYDDYAHHPTEINALLTAVKKMDYKRIICVFQPHTYSRTVSLLPSFISALSQADMAFIADIYAAREADVFGVSASDISDKLDNSSPIHDMDEIYRKISQIAENGDIILTIGAGNINKLSKDLVKLSK